MFQIYYSIVSNLTDLYNGIIDTYFKITFTDINKDHLLLSNNDIDDLV